jgi:flagellar hook assembly protein FlgD
VRLRILDVAGRTVRTLVDGSIAAGSHEWTWDGTDARGRPLPAGVYFQRIETRSRSFSRKLILLR